MCRCHHESKSDCPEKNLPTYTYIQQTINKNHHRASSVLSITKNPVVRVNGTQVKDDAEVGKGLFGRTYVYARVRLSHSRVKNDDSRCCAKKKREKKKAERDEERSRNPTKRGSRRSATKKWKKNKRRSK